MAKKAPADGEEKPGGKKKLIIIMLVAVLLSGGGVYFMMSKKNAPVPPPEPGAVVKLDPLHVNLADGHFLKITMVLQGTTLAPKELDGAEALDEAVSYLSLRPIADMGTPAARDHLKENLIKRIEDRYNKKATEKAKKPTVEIMDVYVTEFVTQ